MRKGMKKLLAGSKRGMTLLEIMIVLAIIALVMGLLVGPKVMKLFGESKVEVAKLTIKKFTEEAYPLWSRSHQDKPCPDKLEDLSEYMDKKDTNDPWGHAYKFYCGQNLPPGAKGGIAVMSGGPDEKEGTNDDIKSWE
jgi:prepilin-type N-terminal cleavage/methylation domain-containing protein